MERRKRSVQVSVEGLEGRMLLTTFSGVTQRIIQKRGVAYSSPLAQTSNNTTFDYTTSTGAKVQIDLTGPGESVRSGTIGQWREKPGEIGRHPAIYLIAAPSRTTGTRRGRPS